VATSSALRVWEGKQVDNSILRALAALFGQPAATPATPLPVVLTELERAPRFPTRTALQVMARKHRVGSATWVARAPKAELFRALQSEGVIA
jgi:hypothetical protein